MKKVFLAVMIASLFMFVGCGANVKIEDCISEQTWTYFYGETEGGKCSISVGEREKIYKLDGIHGQLCDFSLVVLSLNKQSFGGSIVAEISVNEEKTSIVLELNPLNMSYMADLGYALNGDDEVVLSFGGENFNLKNISKNFEVDYNQAKSLALKSLKESGELTSEGECYLKILDGASFGEKGLYWCFNIVGREKNSKNVLINVMNGEEILQAFVCN